MPNNNYRDRALVYMGQDLGLQVGAIVFDDLDQFLFNCRFIFASR